MKIRNATLACLILILSGLLGSGAGAVALSDGVVQQLKDEGIFDDYVARTHQRRADGMDQPMVKTPDQNLALSNQMVTHKVLVILIDFPDKTWNSGHVSADSAMFDSLLFSDGKNPTGSMREFYIENSYGNYIIEGTVAGWYRAAHSYTNYNDQYEEGEPFEYGARALAQEAVIAADADVEYDLFDNNGTSSVDAVIVVHAGTGYEETGNPLEIHSHSSSFNGVGVAVDGVFVRAYTIQPEETPSDGGRMNAIGVFCHEWGHVLGLPDLYDIDGTSAGIGSWGLMGSGNYNGKSKLPAHLTAWSKYQLGWLSLTNVDSNVIDVPIPAVEYNPVAYRLNKNGNPDGLEFWIVENRQLMASDSGLPGQGLIVYHIDESISCVTNICNTNEWWPRVFIEQADGNFNLQYNDNRGDGGDPFSAVGASDYFHDRSMPNSKYYGLSSSEVALWNVSAPDSIMTADFDVNFSRPYLTKHVVVFSDVIGGDGDFRLEAGETVQVTLRMINYWADAENVTVTLTSDDTTLGLLEDNVLFGTLAGGADSANSQLPFEFQIPAEVIPRIDSFFFQVTANDGAYDTTFAAEAIVGTPQLLLVADDDDNADGYEDYVNNPFYAERKPVIIWNTVVHGSPTSADLGNYHVVIWQTGDYRTGILNADDIAAMKDYLDGGGNLFLNGQGLAKQLSTQDPDFLNNYLKAEYIDSTFGLIPIMEPTDGPISGDLDWMVIQDVGSAANQTIYDHVLPVGGGVAEWMINRYFYPPELQDDYGGVSYRGDYKVVFFAFGFEAIASGDSRFSEREEVLQKIMEFFGDLPTDVADDSGPGALPTRLSLNQNFPNPFNPTTTISYMITSGSGARIERTRLEIFDVLGRKVRTLIDREEAPGHYTVIWDGQDGEGRQAASGVYFYRLTRGDLRESRKMILLK